jgi:hypothetical protein
VAESQRSFDWYLNSALASVTALLLLVALVYCGLALSSGDGSVRELGPVLEFPRLAGLVLVVVALAVLLFWIRMLNDYFRYRPEKYTIAWGWALFMMSLWAALAYFWFVWRPRNSHSHQAAA